MNQINKKRLIFVLIVFALGYFLVIVKAFKIQVIDRTTLLERLNNQIFREVKVFPRRGNILDRNGNPLAINIQTYSIFTLPKELESPTDTYKKLVQIVPELQSKDLLNNIKKRKKYTWIARKVQLTEEQVKALKDLKGIYLEPVPKRFYPNKQLASQILGFVGLDNTGLAGVEYQFDKELRGKPKIYKYVIDAKGRAIKFESSEVGDEARDLQLTIDKDIQLVAEKHLKEAVEESGALGGGVGVMDAKTGEILAMANYPSYDPNDPSSGSPSAHRSAFVSDPFEPGSVMKSLTIASALEHKVVTPDTNYFCEHGKFKVEDHFISEAESKKKYEWLSVSEILEHSSNIGTTKIAFDLTYPRLRQTLIKFNVGSKTDIELAGESKGIFYDSENISPLVLSNLSFGQGLAMTGIQVLNSYAMIANGGYAVKPTLIKGKNDNAKFEKFLSDQTVSQLKEMLIRAVDVGTGSNAKIKYFNIAGKTSTAQKISKGGGYKGYIPGFAGFPVNVDNPFVIFVYVDDPKGAYYGNQIATPVFRKIAEYMLFRNNSNKQIKYFASVNSPENNLDTVKVKDSSTRIKGEGLVPDFRGLDKNSSLELGEKFDLRLNMVGVGIVKEQRPAPGSPFHSGSKIELIFSPPKYE
ncbi:MAG: penicillin-binding protein [Bacteriovoracaceae bacterium]